MEDSAGDPGDGVDKKRELVHALTQWWSGMGVCATDGPPKVAKTSRVSKAEYMCFVVMIILFKEVAAYIRCS